MIDSLSQGSFAPQQPVTRAADPSLPSPAQSDSHKTPLKEMKPPEAVPIESKPLIKLSSPPSKPSHAREPETPKAPVGDVRWSLRLDKQGKSNIGALFSANSSLTDLGTPQKRSPPPSIRPSKKGKGLVHRSSSTLNRSLGKRKRGSGAPKSRKKGTTISKTAAKGKEVVQYDESDQPPVMVRSP